MSIEHTQIAHTELIDVLKNILAQEENAIRLVIQKNTGEKFLYPPLDDVLYTNVDKVLDILDFIVSTKFMVKKQVETLKFCPICFSYEIIPTEHCINCGSTNISRQDHRALCLRIQEPGKHVCDKRRTRMSKMP